MSNLPFEKMYPDVLGAISGGVRVDMNVLQVAPGIFPSQAFVNQPVELVLLLQNMIDQPVQVTVTLHLPNQDRDGNPLVIDTPAPVTTQTLDGAEVGVLRVPMVVYPPSVPGHEVPVGVQIKHRTSRSSRVVRPSVGGPPPVALAISPFKLQALREVMFTAPRWSDQSDIMTLFFDIAPKRMQPLREPLTSRYERIWTTRELAHERQHLEEQLTLARAIAASMTSGELYPVLLSTTAERFIAHGMPLEDGEFKAITKMVTYTLSDAAVEQSFEVEKTRWFQTLCHVLAYDERTKSWPAPDIAARYLYDAALFDAVLHAFKIIQPRLREKLGSIDERRDYARRVVSWLGKPGDTDVGLTYLPLVFGGVAVNLSVGTSVENPWIMLDDLREAAVNRIRTIKSEDHSLFDTLEKLLALAEDDLVRAHITHP